MRWSSVTDSFRMVVYRLKCYCIVAFRMDFALKMLCACKNSDFSPYLVNEAWGKLFGRQY